MTLSGRVLLHSTALVAREQVRPIGPPLAQPRAPVQRWRSPQRRLAGALTALQALSEAATVVLEARSERSGEGKERRARGEAEGSGPGSELQLHLVKQVEVVLVQVRTEVAVCRSDGA